nr:hypothetical protein CFP56_55295 [Quercus suber]
MIQLISPPYSRLGEANNSPCLEFFEPTPLLLVDGKGDEGAGLGFPEQPLLPWMAIAASGGSLGSGGNGWRGRSGDRNLDPEKVLHGLVILLFLLNMVRARSLGQSRKKTSDVYTWVSMSSYLLSFKQSDVLSRQGGSLKQRLKVVATGSVDESGGEGEGVLLEREHWRPQDLVSLEGEGGGSGTGGDGPKRFGESCFKTHSITFTDLLKYLHPQHYLSSDSEDRLVEATNCCVEANETKATNLALANFVLFVLIFIVGRFAGFDLLETVYNRCCEEHFEGQKPGRVGDPHVPGSVLESQKEFRGEADELLGVHFESRVNSSTCI